MKKLMIVFGAILCLVLKTEAGKKVIKTSVFFETAKHELSEEGKQELYQFIKENVKGNDYEILIQGHADKRGDLAYNDALSLRRANKVKEIIGNKGISSDLIELSYYGERSPKIKGGSHKVLSQNRRVDVILNIYTFNSMEEIQDALKENSVSEFEINPTEDNLLKAKNGSKVLIEANSFKDINGKLLTENVEVEITEAIKMEEWVANDLSTESNGQVIESGGMMKIVAKTISGKEVMLFSDKPITVSLPNKKNELDKRMEMFSSNAGDTWTAIGNRPLNLSAIKMPPFPQRKHASLNYVPYKVDYSTKPRKPRLLYEPNEPHKPREMDMQWNIHWYTLNKKKKEAKNVAHFHKQLTNYYIRMERFKRSNKKFKNAELNHQKDLMTYEEDLKDWFDSINIKRNNWKLLPVNNQALKDYDSLNTLYRIIHKREVAEWQEARKAKIGEIADKMDDMGITNSVALNTYVFTMNNLGWINCDRFTNVPPEQKREVVILDSDTSRKKVMLVFKNLNSSINMAKVGKKYSNTQIPNNEEIMVFSFKVKDGIPYVFLKEVEFGDTKMKMDFRPSSFAEIKKILAGFDRG